MRGQAPKYFFLEPLLARRTESVTLSVCPFTELLNAMYTTTGSELHAAEAAWRAD